MKNRSVVALIVAAGKGERFGGIPKQLRYLNGKPMLMHSVEIFAQHPLISKVLVVVSQSSEEVVQPWLLSLGLKLRKHILPTVIGGESRQDSVLAGLSSLIQLNEPEDTFVLIHDAARPNVSSSLIDRVIQTAYRLGNATPALPSSDTLKRVRHHSKSKILSVEHTLDRQNIYAVQTPQAFPLYALYEAHKKASASEHKTFTDDASVYEAIGKEVFIVPGCPKNHKITFSEDLQFMTQQPIARRYRVGTGFDIHAFEAGDHVWLGGVKVPCEFGVRAHSDGDVILHALTDALLGVVGDHDIGTHFPPSDPRWNNHASSHFVAFAHQKLVEHNIDIEFIDVMMLAETPRLKTYRHRVCKSVADLLQIDTQLVSLKATTMEQVGAIGRKEAIAAQVTVTCSFLDNTAKHRAT